MLVQQTNAVTPRSGTVRDCGAVVAEENETAFTQLPKAPFQAGDRRIAMQRGSVLPEQRRDGLKKRQLLFAHRLEAAAQPEKRIEVDQRAAVAVRAGSKGL